MLDKEPKLIKLYKENGQEMKVNENSYEYAVKVLGWSKAKPKAEK